MDSQARQPIKQRLFLAAVILGAAGAFIASSRTARVRHARITRQTDSFADVALDYTAGSRPQYVIVDLRGEPGVGSATIEGQDDSVRVAITGPLGKAPQIELTASTRVLGRLSTRRVVFGG